MAPQLYYSTVDECVTNRNKHSVLVPVYLLGPEDDRGFALSETRLWFLAQRLPNIGLCTPEHYTPEGYAYVARYLYHRLLALLVVAAHLQHVSPMEDKR